MTTVNVIMMLIGILLMALGGYGMTTLRKYGLPQTGVLMLLAMGVFVFLLAFLGCYGVWKRVKKAIFLYIVLVFVVCLLEIVGGALVLSYVGELNAIAGNTLPLNNSAVTFTQGQAFITMDKLTKCVFTTCCKSAAAMAMANSSSCSSFTYAAEFCGLLNGTGVVKLDTATCANQDALLASISGWVAGNLRPLGMVCLVFAVFQFLIIVASCGLLWRKGDDFDEAEG